MENNTKVSIATTRNWKKLNVQNIDNKLKARANKTNSIKQITPIEYFSDKENIPNTQNIIEKLLKINQPIINIIFSLINAYFKQKDINFKKENVKTFLSEYSHINIISSVLDINLPTNENDILGLVYQSLCLEGEKNKAGMYYTPSDVVVEAFESIKCKNTETILDPCCGSGGFLLNAPIENPTQLYGFEVDPIAVMICKANLIVKYKDFEFNPQVFLCDFLSDISLFDDPDTTSLKNKKFDYIFTNPPWGAIANNKTYPDTYAYFLSKSLLSLKAKGFLFFILPESFLNVKAYSSLRLKILSDYSVKKIALMKNIFNGVSSKVISILIENIKSNDTIDMVCDNKTYKVENSHIINSPNYVFSLTNDIDRKILKKLEIKGKYNLEKSDWALGIVTGSNKSILLDKKIENSEPIYTGKEISAYMMLPPKKFIIYDRKTLQQVAKDELYRTNEKLAYKFISHKLVFAYDNTGSLFLNSANILIPKVPTINILALLVFLNSELFQYAYKLYFGEIKILKSNLCQLQFPNLSLDENKMFSNLTKNILQNDNHSRELAQKAIYDFYDITDVEIKQIKEKI